MEEPRAELEDLDVGMMDIFKMGADLGLISNEEVTLLTAAVPTHYSCIERVSAPTSNTSSREKNETRARVMAESFLWTLLHLWIPQPRSCVRYFWQAKKGSLSAGRNLSPDQLRRNHAMDADGDGAAPLSLVIGETLAVLWLDSMVVLFVSASPLFVQRWCDHRGYSLVLLPNQTHH